MQMGGSFRLGIIGGGGWLGNAICEAILNVGIVQPQSISLSYRRSRPSRFHDLFWTTDNQELVERSDVVILSVRPEDWPSVTDDMEGRLVISVMAGIRLSAIWNSTEPAAPFVQFPTRRLRYGNPTSHGMR